MSPSVALVLGLVLVIFFSFLSRCNGDVLFNFRVSSLAESDLIKYQGCAAAEGRKEGM